MGAATALGIWADGVVLALDRAVRLGAPDDTDRQTFEDAIKVVADARDLSEHPGRATGKALAATGAALDVAEDLSEDDSPGRTRELLTEIEKTLRAAIDDQLAQAEGARENVVEAAGYFTAIGRRQLAEGNRISNHGGGPERWKVKRTMSISS
jgi:hypothetical protein